MVLKVDEDDTRCPLVAGMEDVSIDEVLRPRECILTNKSYDELSIQTSGPFAVPASFTKRDVREQVFHGGRLFCRVIIISIYKTKSPTPYSGIKRQLYAKEADPFGRSVPITGPGASKTDPIAVDDDEDDFFIVNNNSTSQSKKRAAFDSSVRLPRKRLSPVATKAGYFTFGDVFCGAGGASQGATQAGLHVKWGLDLDEYAIKAYQKNHVGALPFCSNAHDFPPQGYTSEELRVDVLHLSPTCKYYSPAQ
jgi:DNA (cytosine-5)-methyltransferase 1